MAFALTTSLLKKYVDGKIDREQVVSDIMDMAGSHLFSLQDKVVKASAKVNSNLTNNPNFNKSVAMFISNEMDDLLTWLTSELDTLLANRSLDTVVSLIKQEVDLSASAIKDIPNSASENKGQSLSGLTKKLRGTKENISKSNSIGSQPVQQKTLTSKTASEYIKPKSSIVPKSVVSDTAPEQEVSVKPKSGLTDAKVIGLLESIEENTRNLTVIGSGGFFTGIIKGFKGVFGKMFSVFTDPVRYMKNLMMAPVYQIRDMFISIKDKILAPFRVIGSMFSGIKSWFKGLFGNIDQNKFRKTVLKSIKELLETDKKILSAIIGNYKAPTEPNTSGTKEDNKLSIDKIKGFIPSLLKGIGGLLLKPIALLGVISGAIGSVFKVLTSGRIIQLLGSIASGIAKLAGTALKGVVSGAKSILDSFGNTGKSGKKLPPRDSRGRFVKATTLKDRAKGLLKGAGNALKSAGRFVKMPVGAAASTSLLGTGAAVAGAGIAGWETGRWLDEKFQIGDKLSSKLVDFMHPEKSQKEYDIAYWNSIKADGTKMIGLKFAEKLKSYGIKVPESRIRIQAKKDAARLNETTQKTDEIKNDVKKQEQQNLADKSSAGVMNAVNNVVNNQYNSMSIRSPIRSEERTFNNYWKTLQPV